MVGRQSAENKKLSGYEAYCRMLIETARVYIHYFTPDGTVTFMNKYAEEVSGYSEEEVVGKKWMDIFVPPWNRQTVLRDLEPVMSGQPTKNYKASMLTKDGTERVMLWSGARVVRPDGTVEGIVASGIDVTELEQAQKALMESEQNYKALVDNDLAAIMVVNEDGLLFMSSRSEELTGYSYEELSRLPMWHLVHPDDREKVKQLTISIIESQRPSITEEFRVITKSGDTLEMYGRGVPINYLGKPAVLASAIDITEFKRIQQALKQSEDLYRTLVDNSLAAIAIIRHGQFLFINKIAEEFTGYTIEELMQGGIARFMHPDDRQMVLERGQRRLHGEDEPERYELRIITKSGDVRTLEVHATIIEYEGEKATLANFIDITERCQIEEEKLRTERELAAHRQRLYSEAINALTNGKLDVTDPENAAKVMSKPHITVELGEASDASLARHLVKDLAEDNGLYGNRLEEFLLAVGEASVNALKHAGRGRLSAGAKDGDVWVGVTDQGPGMDTFVLTKAVLGKGFSTKPSLGLGYTFIISGSDHVLLATSPQGTSVVMEKSIAPPPVFPLDLSRIPDLWQSAS